MVIPVTPDILEWVDKFSREPFQLSSREQENGNNWRNLVMLLHILLVKYDLRKTNVIFDDDLEHNIRKNAVILSKKLKIPMKQSIYPIGKTMPFQTQIFSNEFIIDLYKASANPCRLFIYYNNDDFVNKLIEKNTKTMGRFLEYPDCCIIWLIKSQISDYETAYLLYESQNLGIIKNNDPVSFIIQKSSDLSFPPILIRRIEIWKNQFLQGRQKFPFILHHPCNDCLSKPNSPSEILNQKYSKFVKNNFLSLYNSIISESKKNIKYYKDLIINAKETLKNEDSRYELPPISNFDMTLD